MTDMEKIGMGMFTHEAKLKELGVTPRENILIAYRHGTPPVLPNLFVDGGIVGAAMHLEHYCGHDQGRDAWGVHWTYVPEEHSVIPTPGKYILKDITQWREVVKFPDLDAIDWAAQADRDIHMDVAHDMMTGEYRPLPNGAAFNDGNKCAIVISIMGMFERLHTLMGVDQALMAMAEEPEECFAFFSAVADWKIKLYKKVKEHYPVDVINAHDDYGTQDRMFMSLDMWRELFKPNLKRIVDACHEMGLLYQHHSCGYMEPLIPEFVEIGVDAMDSLQGACNKNLVDLKKKYGSQITFLSGFDTTYVFDRPGVTDQECKDEYLRVVNNLGPGGSYIAYQNGLTQTCMNPCLAQHFDICYDFYTN